MPPEDTCKIEALELSRYDAIGSDSAYLDNTRLPFATIRKLWLPENRSSIAEKSLNSSSAFSIKLDNKINKDINIEAIFVNVKNYDPKFEVSSKDRYIKSGGNPVF